MPQDPIRIKIFQMDKSVSFSIVENNMSHFLLPPRLLHSGKEKFMPNPHRSTESGNVLIYILIAIVAFAALSFALSNSGRESVSTIDREKSDLGATEIFDYANAVRASVQNMLVQGVRQNQICFDSPAYGATTFQYAACSTATNKVFDTAGGNAPAPRQVSPGLLEDSRSAMANYGIWYFPDTVRVSGAGQDCVTAECNELVATLAPLKKAVCLSINKKLGITNPDIVPINTTAINLTPFLGSFTYDSIIDTANLVGKRTGCFQNAIGGPYIFFAVLKAN
jgi:hypothetical protein